MGGRGGHRRVTGLTGQERSAVFSHGRGSSERERLRHSHQPSFHRTFPRESRLQARAPESPAGGLQGEAEPHSIAVVGPDQPVPTRNHTDAGSAQSSPLRERGHGVCEPRSPAWTPLPSPETGGAAVWAMVTAASGDSPLDAQKAPCVVSGALTACLAQSRCSLEAGELMSCQAGDVARGTSHHPLEQHDQDFPPPRKWARACVSHGGTRNTQLLSSRMRLVQRRL